jgi:electron transfer flavoprotein beta subunit
MGADRAVLVQTDTALEPLAVAKLLRAIAVREQPGLILLGKQATDDDAPQTGQMLAALLGWGQGTSASRIDVQGGSVRVTREIDNGRETLELDLPAVITADLRLNEPRYVKLPNLIQAKKKAIEIITPEALGVDVTPRVRVLRVAEPPPRAPGPRLASVDDLIDRLKHEHKVLP